MTTYLVTGGAGFIGSHIVDELVRRGERVKVLDNFSTGRRENLAHVIDRIELIEGDIRDLAVVKAAARRVDYVLHQAGLSSVRHSALDLRVTNDIHVTGTLNVLMAAREAGVCRVIFASTSWVYGRMPEVAKQEAAMPQPQVPFGVSKLAGENCCHAFFEEYSLPIVVLRYFHVFGPRQDFTLEYSAVIPRFIIALLRGQPPTIYGDGLQLRDFTYVTDVVQANLLACEKTDAAGQVINIACGKPHTLLDLYRDLTDLMGMATVPPPVFAPVQAGEMRHSVASIDKATRMLGYRPNVEWRAGLRRTIDWCATRIQTDR